MGYKGSLYIMLNANTTSLNDHISEVISEIIFLTPVLLFLGKQNVEKCIQTPYL